jgi:acetyl esterase/lipase
MSFDTLVVDSMFAVNEFKIDMDQFAKKVVNLPYTTDLTNERQRLDIIYPEETIGPYKVIVLLHGGGWMSGDKQSESIAPIFEAFNQGYAVVSVNYRLSGEARWPAQIFDVKAAIRFLRENADTYRLDADQIVVWGVDAGGHLALMLAATNNQIDYEELSMGSSGASSAVDGVIAWYAPTELLALPPVIVPVANRLLGFSIHNSPDRARLASPLDMATADFPPVLLVHGTSDSIVYYQQAVDLVHKVNVLTGDLRAELTTFEEGIHGDPMIRSSVNVLNNLDFADKIYYKEKNPYRTLVVKDIKVVFNLKNEDDVTSDFEIE